MGDLVGEAVEGTLYYLPLSEFKKVRGANQLSKFQRAKLVADMCRLNALYMIARAGSGHIGSSFSSMEIFSWLLTEELDLSDSVNESADIFFSSKGHDAPGYYAIQMAMGRLPFDLIHKLRRIDGLPGHPDIGTPGIFTNTGSLGMGVSKAKGMVLANRLANKEARVFVLTGDGELQEGQFWESLASAVNFGLHEITVIVDHNKLQSDTFLKNVSDLGDLEGKLRAFGWRVERCDGNNIDSLAMTIASLNGEKRPQIIIADTIKGKGVSFMEHTSLDSDVDMYRFHSGAPDGDSYRKAVQEITDRLDQRARDYGVDDFKFETSKRETQAIQPATLQRLIPAYSKALVEQASKNQNLVALDADLILDTGLISFREKYPKRFIECGIAEQDMVSMAGGLALSGMLPVVHSFACFLTARPNEQIYNNATEKTKVIYVGSLAGALPGGPGHSHQAVRDIAALSGIPNLIMVEPSCESEVSLLLNWCINECSKSSYLRLVSLPWNIPYTLPSTYKAEIGKGVTIIDGADIGIVASGPIMLSAAFNAAKVINEKYEKKVKVINFPWLNAIDEDWFLYTVKGLGVLISLDNHYRYAGQSVVFSNAITRLGLEIKYEQYGIENIPPSGTVDEVLNAIKMDEKSLISKIEKHILK